MSDFATSALEAVNFGIEVFPLAPGSKVPPRGLRWMAEATTDPQRIFEWAERYPDANAAAACRDLLVFDVDGPGGEARRQALGVEWPATLRVQTRRGEHWLYRAKLPRGHVKSLGPELDVKGNRAGEPMGYTVLPASTVKGHRYRFTGADTIAPATEEMLALVEPQHRPDTGWRLGVPIYEGSRNHKLTQLAGALRRDGFSSPDAIEAALMAANLERCRPPLPEKEVRKIATSAAKWNRPPLWITDPEEFVRDNRLSGPARLVLLALSWHAKVNSRARPGVRRICKLTGLAPATVTRAIRELEEAGRILVSRSREGNRYTICFYSPTPKQSGTSVSDLAHPRQGKG